MRKAVRLLTTFSALGLSAAVLAGCGGAAGAQKPVGNSAANSATALTLNIGDQVRTTESLLEAAGQLKDLPYKINWSTFDSGPPLLEALNSNHLDAGATGDVPAVFSLANGGTNKIIATLTQKPSSDFLLVPQDSAATSIKDLKGKKITVPQGSSAHGLLLGLIDQAGLAPSDFSISYLQPSDALSAFSNGQVDAWSVWNPYAATAQKQVKAKVIGDGLEVATQQSYFSASQAAIADPAKSAALKDFLARLAKAQTWGQQNPDAWTPIYSKLTKLPQDVAAATFKTSDGSWGGSTPSVVQKQQKLIDLFAANKIIGSKPEAKSGFDDSLAASIGSGS